jgi:hypothetical protein
VTRAESIVAEPVPGPRPDPGPRLAQAAQQQQAAVECVQATQAGT